VINMTDVISIHSPQVPQEVIENVEKLLLNLKAGNVDGVALVWTLKNGDLHTLVNTKIKVSQLSLGTLMVQRQLTDSAIIATIPKG